MRLQRENASILAIATVHSKGATLNEIAYLQERLPPPILPFYQESYLKFQKVKASAILGINQAKDNSHANLLEEYFRPTPTALPASLVNTRTPH